MSKFYVVSSDILPEVLEKVLEARMLLQSGKVKRISEAVKQVGISRGTYYKYKDTVFSFSQSPTSRSWPAATVPAVSSANRKAVITMTLRSEKGTLSKVSSLISAKQVNILAINQTIPINGIHNVSFTLDISDLEGDIQAFLDLIEAMAFVDKVDLVAIE